MPGRVTATAARAEIALSAQRSTCGWNTVTTVPSAAFASRGQATSGAGVWANAETLKIAARK